MPRMPRVRELERDGVLTADWARIAPAVRAGYRAMVDAMTRCGVTTGGRPPV